VLDRRAQNPLEGANLRGTLYRPIVNYRDYGLPTPGSPGGVTELPEYSEKLFADATHLQGDWIW